MEKDGKTYKNYGSYIMQTYAEHPDNFNTNYKSCITSALASSSRM